MTNVLRIGTRDSPLALWQARTVQDHLKQIDVQSELVPIKSDGDLNRDRPIDQLGITGVFTKSLDEALINDKIDIAVHSLKDVPTLLPDGIHQGAVLKRSSYLDVLIASASPEFLNDASRTATIATGSLRRKSQWLNRYPHHQIIGLRGNVETRLNKLSSGSMDGIILSSAGINRLKIRPEHMVSLDWMVPAPAQGVMGIFCRSDDMQSKNLLVSINDPITEMTSHAERQLLRTLEGGCTAPIGALASISQQAITLKACLLNTTGTKKVEIMKELHLNEFRDIGYKVAQEMLQDGGSELINEIKNGG